jgi:enoyl-CoA hydratase/carnithine racemase
MSDPASSAITDDRLAAGAVELHVCDARADVVLARPQARNAQTPATWRALAAIPELLPGDVRVVVLSARGASFSAGLDRAMIDGSGVPGEPALRDLAKMPASDLSDTIAGYQRAFTWWRESDAVSVAAVQGHAVGAGFQLALATDVLLCADDAQLAMRETSLGLVPDLGGTAPLVAAVGYSRALEICATGRWVRAEEAYRLGLAQMVVGGDALAAATDDLVAALLAAPGGALSATKRLLAGATHRTRAEQLDAERTAQVGRLGELARLLG